VVDDDPALLKMLAAVLRQHGFHAWLAASGQEAEDLYRQHAAAIAAVLLDVRLGDRDGPQTLAALRLINPAIRACFMTGEAGRYTEEALLSMGSPAVLKKPFPVDELLRILEQLVAD
jgi:DNA-binding response OmpR family regulator